MEAAIVETIISIAGVVLAGGCAALPGNYMVVLGPLPGPDE